MNKLVLWFFVFGGIYLSSSNIQLMAQISEDLELMGQWMQGDYSVDSHSSTEANHLCIQRIWNDKTNGVWFYAELQKTESNKVLEQYVYLASDITYGEYSLDKYVPKKSDELIGACKKPDLFVGLTPFDLSYMSGCSMFLTYDGFQFEGSSNDETCKVNNETGDYKVKQFNLTTTELTILEKLYEASGNQKGNKNGVLMKYSKK